MTTLVSTSSDPLLYGQPSDADSEGDFTGNNNTYFGSIYAKPPQFWTSYVQSRRDGTAAYTAENADSSMGYPRSQPESKEEEKKDDRKVDEREVFLRSKDDPIEREKVRKLLKQAGVNEQELPQRLIDIDNARKLAVEQRISWDTYIRMQDNLKQRAAANQTEPVQGSWVNFVQSQRAQQVLVKQ